MIRPRHVILAAVLVVALAGCTPPGAHRPTHTRRPPATPSASASALGTATPRPTPTAAATKPTLDQLVVTVEGLGELHVGSPVPSEPPALALVQYNATHCSDLGLGTGPGTPGAGAWMPTYPDGPSALGALQPFDVGPSAARDSAIALVDVWSPALHTATGIHVGSTVAQLHAAYGSALTVNHASNSDVYVLRGTHSELLFETANHDAADPTNWTAAQVNTVVWMRVVPITETQLHIANTDGAGPCSI